MGLMPGGHRVFWEGQVSIECDGGMPDDEHLGGVEIRVSQIGKIFVRKLSSIPYIVGNHPS